MDATRGMRRVFRRLAARDARRQAREEADPAAPAPSEPLTGASRRLQRARRRPIHDHQAAQRRRRPGRRNHSRDARWGARPGRRRILRIRGGAGAAPARCSMTW
ncbi:MAG: hypothetical protein IPM84_14860 [Anaerolineae bacterium]|nr:hypothetical protein [Anaerolineae bacterium]